jgi:hypothetical protein
MAQAIFRAKPFPVYTPTFTKPSSFRTHLPAYEDGTECSETSAFKTQTPGNYPNEIIQHSKHGESLKSKTATFIYELVAARICLLFHHVCLLLDPSFVFKRGTFRLHGL